MSQSYSTARLTRRQFVAGVSAAGAMASGGLALSEEDAELKPLKLSLAAYSMRKFLRAEPSSAGAMNMEGFVDYCAKLQLDGTELTSYFFPKQITTPYLLGLRRRAVDAGLAVSGGAIGNNFTLPSGAKLDEQIAHTRTWIDYYATLGAPAIRVFAGRPAKGVSEDEAIARCVPILEQMSDEAGKKGIKLALENHDFTTRVDRMMAIVKAVRSKWFGVNFDSGNFHSDDPYRDMETIAPYAINAQIKTEIRIGDGPKQSADLPRIIKILRDAGYDSWVVLEYEAAEDPYAATPRYVDRLRKIVRDV